MSKLVGLTAAWQQSKVEGHSVGEDNVNSPKANNTSVHTEFNFFIWDMKNCTEHIKF